MDLADRKKLEKLALERLDGTMQVWQVFGGV
jgi:hypothetical protein